jgi:hypothetical protein
MMSNTWVRTLLCAVVSFFIMNSATIYAAVDWSENSIQEVFNPKGNVYAYAPSVIVEQDAQTGSKIEHIWTCQNNESGIIKDHIYYTKLINGKVAENKLVLSPGPTGSWDSFHTCDPTVVGGKFAYHGVTYNYAMFYLGNNVDASKNNQIGVAFSNQLDGDTWVKYPEPIIAAPMDGSWGVGQPSVTAVNEGHVLLFYTKGTSQLTGGFCMELDLNDMRDWKALSNKQLSNDGLINLDGSPDFLNNFDIAYDGTRDRFFAVREMHPYPSSNPSYISGSQQIVSIPAANVWGGGGTWTVEGIISPELTGHPRNHNAGIAKTVHGGLPNPSATPQADALKVIFTRSCAGESCEGQNSLWSYDLWEIQGKLINFTGTPLDIGPVNLTDIKGNAVKALKGNSFIQVMTSVKNKDIKAWSASLIVALYDKSGALTHISTVEKSLQPNENATYSAGFNLPADTTGCYIKVFAVNSLYGAGGLKPLSPEFKFPLRD